MPGTDEDATETATPPATTTEPTTPQPSTSAPPPTTEPAPTTPRRNHQPLSRPTRSPRSRLTHGSDRRSLLLDRRNVRDASRDRRARRPSRFGCQRRNNNVSSRACGSQMATQDKRGGNGRNAGNGSYLRRTSSTLSIESASTLTSRSISPARESIRVTNGIAFTRGAIWSHVLPLSKRATRCAACTMVPGVPSTTL